MISVFSRVSRDEEDAQRILELADATTSLRYGRSFDCDTCLDWDPDASKLHAGLERTGSHWLLVADGLSSNGTTPATNPHIAAELLWSVAAVKTHLRVLRRAFGIEQLPQREKRRRLVALAFSSGIVRGRDL